jgi:hypothetical protein
VLTFAVAAYSFKWDRRHATRRGHPALALLAILPFVAGMLASLGQPGPFGTTSGMKAPDRGLDDWPGVKSVAVSRSRQPSGGDG